MAIEKAKKTKSKGEGAELKLAVLSPEGKKLQELIVEPKLLAVGPHSQVVHDAAVMYLANRRRGTASCKPRSEVNKTTKKPWRQKGTGRARAGMASSPLWRGGGVVFGPLPRDFSYQIPKKVKRLALVSAVAQKIRDQEVVIVQDLKLAQPKTKQAFQILKNIEAVDSALLVTRNSDKILNQAIRNIPRVEATTLINLNAYDVLAHKKLVMTQDVFEQFSTVVGGGK